MYNIKARNVEWLMLFATPVVEVTTSRVFSYRNEKIHGNVFSSFSQNKERTETHCSTIQLSCQQE